MIISSASDYREAAGGGVGEMMDSLTGSRVNV